MKSIIKTCIFLLFLLFLAFIVGNFNSAQAAQGNVQGRSKTILLPAVEGAVRYNIYYKERGSSSFIHSVPNLPVEAESYTINYLKPSVTYVYKVAALDAGGKEFWWSNEKFLWGNSGNYSANSVKPSSIKDYESDVARWQKDDKAEYYNLYYKESGQKGYPYAVPRIPREAVNLSIGALKKAVTYKYKIAAYYGGKEHWQKERILKWGRVLKKDRYYSPSRSGSVKKKDVKGARTSVKTESFRKIYKPSPVKVKGATDTRKRTSSSRFYYYPTPTLEYDDDF